MISRSSIFAARLLALASTVSTVATAADWQADTAAGGRVELSGGFLPIQADDATNAAFALEVAPAIGVRLRDRRQALTLRYYPRLYRRFPNELRLTRPLLLHRTDARYVRRLTRRATFQSRVALSVGEIDYSSIRLVLDRTTGVVDAEIVPVMAVEASSRVEVATSKRTTVFAEARGGYRRPLDQPSGGDPPLFATSGEASVKVGQSHAITRRDAIGTSLSGGFVASDRSDELAVVGADIAYDRALSPRTRSRLSLGIVTAQSSSGSRLGVVPVGAWSLRTDLERGDRKRLTAGSEVGVRGAFDPLSVTYRPEGYVALDLLLQARRRWTFGPGVTGATSLTSEPLDPRQLETYVAATVPVAYRIVANLFLDFGARGIARGLHVQDGADIQQVELVAFTGLAYYEGTDRERGRWLR